jgi:mono/diheme cytochrome c family protein
MKKVLYIVLLAALGAASLAAARDANGKAIYDRSCKSCHGADGTPNPAVANMMKVEMKDLKSPEVQAMSDTDIKNTIANGKGKMHPIKTVSGSDADDVAAYVHSLKK